MRGAWLIPRTLLWLSVWFAAAGGCRRAAIPDGTPLYAPFNQRKPIAVVTGRVENGRCEVAVRSLLAGRLALRVDEIRLHDAAGEPLRVEPAIRECILAGGGRVRLADRAVGDLADRESATGTPQYEVETSAAVVPLDDPGRTMYREWAWIRRPHGIAEIDAELARLDALPVCPQG